MKKSDRFAITIADKAGLYECKVQEYNEDKEVYYHVDILSPKQTDKGSHLHQPIYSIEMRIDCDTDTYKVKKYFKNIPPEVEAIEERLSDELCKRSKGK